jgi:SHS2 domain-containing protein
MTGGAKFRYLEHTADAKFQAFGATLEEAFANAALAVASLMWDPAQVAAARREPIHVSGSDLKQLLLAFLEEVLYLLETQEFLLCKVEEARIGPGPEGFELQAVFAGETVSEGEVEIFGDVKAITYHEMRIESGETSLVQVVVDV